MSMRLVGETRLGRRAKAGMVGAGVIALALGFLAGGLAEEPAPVYAAACKAFNTPACLQGYRTAAIDVDHIVPGGTSDTPVEPDDGETWNIIAYWNTDVPMPCYETYETASVTVYWDGSGWSISNKNTTSNIIDIDVCDTADVCDAEDTHSYGYRLIAQVIDPIPPQDVYNLRQVVFTTTSVDDGYELDTSACTLGASVSPTSQTFSATDSGPWECGYSCSNSGASVNITYE